MEDSLLIKVGLPISLMIIMAGMGLTLTTADFKRVFVQPRAMAVGTIAQILMIPALAFGLAKVMNLSPAMAVGLVIIAACPGGATSNVFAFLARANVALSVTLTVLASMITIVTIPIFTNIALDLYMGSEGGAAVRLPVVETIIKLTVIVVIPVMVGMSIRSQSIDFARRSEKYVGRFGLVVLVVLIGLIIYQTRNDILSYLAQAGPAAAALNIAGVALGFLSGRLLGIKEEDALTIAVEVGIKNGTIGLLVTLDLLQSLPMSIPSAVYGVLMFAFGGLLVAFGQKRAKATGRSEATA